MTTLTVLIHRYKSVLYQSVYLRDAKAFASFRTTVQEFQSKGSLFVSHNLRQLFLSGVDVPHTDIVFVLEVGQNVQYLALWLAPTVDLMDWLTQQDFPKLRHVSCVAGYLRPRLYHQNDTVLQIFTGIISLSILVDDTNTFYIEDGEPGYDLSSMSHLRKLAIQFQHPCASTAPGSTWDRSFLSCAQEDDWQGIRQMYEEAPELHLILVHMDETPTLGDYCELRKDEVPIVFVDFLRPNQPMPLQVNTPSDLEMYADAEHSSHTSEEDDESEPSESEAPILWVPVGTRDWEIWRQAEAFNIGRE